MSPEDTVRDTSAAELTALREVNARLSAQLGRLVRDLEGRDDVDVRVDLDAPPGEAVVALSPVAPRAGRPATPHPEAGLGDEATAEVREVAARLELIQRDLVRVQQTVEKLLWRAGEAPAPPLARPSA